MAKATPSGAANPDAAALVLAWGAAIDPELLILALTHRSFANEADLPGNNERLEFLGDSVLSIITTDELYHRFPDVPESDLARLRSSVVSQKPLAELARSIGLGEFILLGVGENKTGGRDKASILSDTVEALIGATYLSNGLEPTRKALLQHLTPLIDKAGEPEAVADWKTPLARLVRDGNLGDIDFVVTGSGPDHDRYYTADLLVDGRSVAQGQGRSKKIAENVAAHAGLEVLTKDVHAWTARGRNVPSRHRPSFAWAPNCLCRRWWRTFGPQQPSGDGGSSRSPHQLTGHSG